MITDRNITTCLGGFFIVDTDVINGMGVVYNTWL